MRIAINKAHILAIVLSVISSAIILCPDEGYAQAQFGGIPPVQFGGGGSGGSLGPVPISPSASCVYFNDASAKEQCGVTLPSGLTLPTSTMTGTTNLNSIVSGNITQTFSSTPLVPFFQLSQSFTGKVSGGSAFTNDINIADNADCSIPTACNFFTFDDVVGAASKGGRTGLQTIMAIPATPAGAGTVGQDFYYPFNSSFQVSANLGGTSSSNLFGGVYGGFSQDFINTGATFLNFGDGFAASIALQTGTSIGVARPLEIDWEDDGATRFAAASAIGIQGDYAGSGTAAANGMDYGINFGSAPSPAWPFKSTASLLYSGDISGTKTVAHGVNFLGLTCTVDCFVSPGFQVDGSGNITTSAASGPTFTFNNTTNSRALQIGVVDSFNGVLNVTGGASLLFEQAGARTAAIDIGMEVGPSSTADEGTGTINVSGGYYIAGTAGVTCSGVPSVSFAVTKGVVTHC